MFLQLQQQSLLLGRKPLGFTEHYYMEWDDGLGKEKIALFLLISVASSQIPAEQIAKEAFQLLQDHFLNDLSGDPYERFEHALREVNQMVAAKEREVEMKFIPNVHVVAGVIQKDMLFISQRGEAQGYLLRKRHVSSITEGLFDEKNKEDLFQNIASGSLEVGDNLLFVTGPLVQYVTPSDLARMFSERPISEATKELGDMLNADVEDQLVLLAFEILEKTEETAPTVASVRMGDDEAFEEDSVEPLESGKVSSAWDEKRQKMQDALDKLHAFARRQEAFAFLARVRTWNKKKLLGAILVLLVVISGTLYLLDLTLGQQRQVNAMQAKLDQAQAQVDQASTTGAFDKTSAASSLDTAEDLVAEVLDSGYLGGEASELLDGIQKQRDTLDNVYRVKEADLKLVADLSGKIQTGSKIVSLERKDDRLLIFTDHEALEILTDQVQDPKTVDATEQVVATSVYSDYDALVLLTAGSKVMEYDQGTSQFADTVDVSWHLGVDVGTFSNKIYILDPSANQIWKYQRGNAGYGAATAYLPAGEDLSTATSLAVDGKVWVLLKDGTLLQYYAGEAVDYELKKPPVTAFEQATRLLTSSTMTRLYVLDAAAKRVFVFDKSAKNDDITYSNQYVLDAVPGTVTDIALDQERNVLMFTTGTALYEVAIQ